MAKEKNGRAPGQPATATPACRRRLARLSGRRACPIGARLRRIHGQHRFTRKADTAGGARKAREPPPHLPGEIWFRRLEEAVEAGDARAPIREHRVLVSRIDKAVKSGALHGRNGARKKAAAARLRARL